MKTVRSFRALKRLKTNKLFHGTQVAVKTKSYTRIYTLRKPYNDRPVQPDEWPEGGGSLVSR